MNLSRDIIYYSLSRKYPVRYFKINDTDLMFKRPVIYDDGVDLTNRSVIISAEELNALTDKHASECNVLFICAGKPPKSAKLLAGSVIALENEISPAGLFNAIQEIYDQFDRWDEILKTVCYEGGSFGDLIASTDPLVSDPILLVDKTFHYVAYSKEKVGKNGFNAYMDENDNMTLEAVNDFIADSTFQALYDIPGVFDYSSVGASLGVITMICKNIFYRGDYAGRLIMGLEDSSEFARKYNTAILEYLFRYIDKLFNTYRSFDLKEIILSSLRSLLLDGLNSKEIAEGQWDKAFEENGWTPNDRMQLIQFRQKPHYSKNIYAQYLGTEIEREWQGCACFEYNDRLLMMINLDKSGARAETNFYKAFAYFLRESLLIAGFSRIFKDMIQLRSAYDQTETALDFGLRKAPTQWYYKFDDYVLSYMLSCCTGTFAREQICSEKLLALRRHDTEKKTEYYKTLIVYFECRLNAAAAAKKLFIHRSSFLSRMDRIIALTGIDIDSNEELLYLLLSSKVMENNDNSTRNGSL